MNNRSRLPSDALGPPAAPSIPCEASGSSEFALKPFWPGARQPRERSIKDEGRRWRRHAALYHREDREYGAPSWQGPVVTITRRSGGKGCCSASAVGTSPASQVSHAPRMRPSRRSSANQRQNRTFSERHSAFAALCTRAFSGAMQLILNCKTDLLHVRGFPPPTLNH